MFLGYIFLQQKKLGFLLIRFFFVIYPLVF
jgi:hypothetical protein